MTIVCPAAPSNSKMASRSEPLVMTASWKLTAPPVVVKDQTSESPFLPIKPVKLTFVPVIGSGEAVAIELPKSSAL